MTWLRHRRRAPMAMEAAPTVGRQLARLFSWVKAGTKTKTEDRLPFLVQASGRLMRVRHRVRVAS